jgi:hypothetical protein
MLVAFFDNKGLVYSHIVLKEAIIYAAYIVKVLDVFMKHLRKKGLPWWSRDGFFIGTTPLFTPPSLSRIGSPPTASRSSAIRPICRT